MRKILLFISLFAAVFAEPRPTQDDFNACYEKNLPSIVNIGGYKGVALSENLIAVVKNDDMPVRNYIKFDPFLGLYLVGSDRAVEPVKLSDDSKSKKSDWVSASEDFNSTLYGHVKSLGERLGELDALTFEPHSGLLVLSACCKVRGISVGGGRFVPSRYLKHFMAYEDVYYGDVGAVFEANATKFYVKSVEQLGRGGALLAGDQILSINGEKFGSLRELNERILFAKKGEVLKFEILRGDEIEKFEIPVSSDVNLIPQKPQITQNSKPSEPVRMTTKPSEPIRDFFKIQGISLDQNLIVKRVDDGSKAANFGIKIGDKLIQINKTQVKNYKQALSLTNSENPDYLLLFRRGGFDFFFRAD